METNATIGQRSEGIKTTTKGDASLILKNKKRFGSAEKNVGMLLKSNDGYLVK